MSLNTGVHNGVGGFSKGRGHGAGYDSAGI